MCPCNLADVLLDEEHPLVQKSLLEAIEAKRKDVEKTWLDQHMSYYQSKGLTWGRVHPPSDHASCVWWSAVPHRDQDIISVICRLNRKAARPMLADTSQNIFITPFSSLRKNSNGESFTVSPTALPGSKWWSFVLLRYLIGEEKLCLQGFPTRSVELKKLVADTDDSVLHRCGGDAFSGTVFMAVKFALIRACPWAKPSASKAPAHCASLDIASAMAMLKSARK